VIPFVFGWTASLALGFHCAGRPRLSEIIRGRFPAFLSRPDRRFGFGIPFVLTGTIWRFHHVHRLHHVLILVTFFTHVEEIVFGLLHGLLLSNADITLQLSQVVVVLRRNKIEREKLAFLEKNQNG
jgi:hypothetical protein